MGTFIPILKSYEELICKERQITTDAKQKSIVIGIGGLAGVGKDEMTQGIAQWLKMKYNFDVSIIGAGVVMRRLAKDEGYDQANLDLFLQKVTNCSDYAKEIDIKVEISSLNAALSGNHVILHGRMTPFTIGTWGIGIWLTCKPEIIAERLSKDKRRAEYGLDVQKIMEKNVTRNTVDMERLQGIYGINIEKEKNNLDIVFDTSKYSIEESHTYLIEKIESLLLKRNLVT